MLTGGQMPEQGVPEQQSVKIIAAKTTVEGNASAGVIGVAVKQQPKSPEPVVNKVMRPNISEVNKMASGEGTFKLTCASFDIFSAAPAAPVPPPQMYGQPQFQPAPQQFQQYPMYPQSPQGGYQPFPVQPFPVQPQVRVTQSLNL